MAGPSREKASAGRPETAGPLGTRVVIRASAGSGKTFQLANRFIALSLAGASADEILAMTFARKAAGEILDRVISRVAEAACSPDKLRELGASVGRAGLRREDCLRLLRDWTLHLHRLRIGTLDRFMLQLAGGYGLELGLPPGWRIVQNVDEARMREEAIQDLLREESRADLLTMVHALDKGASKRGLTKQIERITREMYSIWRESDEAAWRGLNRIGTLSEEALETAIDRLEAIPVTASLVKKAWEKDALAARERDWSKFIDKGIGLAVMEGKTTYSRQPIAPELAAAYRVLLTHVTGLTIDRIANQTEATRRLLEKFDRAFDRRRRSRRAYRFEDMPFLLAGTTGDRAQAGPWGAIDFRLDARVDHLLLDEFQDTALSQWQVLRPLAHSIVEGGARRSFFCVGDVKQAIYAWRGGVAEVFDEVGKVLSPVDERALDRGYRSSPVIVDVVNRVFGGLVGNPALEGAPRVAAAWSDRFATHTTARESLPGFVSLEVAPRAAELKLQQNATLRFAAERIATLAAEHPGRTIAALVRRNETVGALIHLLRANHGMLASEEGGNPLDDSAGTRLLLSLVGLADHPGDTILRFHVANSRLGAALGLRDHHDDVATRRIASETRAALLGDGYGATFDRWAAMLAPALDERETARLRQLVDLAWQYEASATLRADDFIRFVRQRRVEDPSTAPVRIMNIHQSKGLEFDLVVLPELDTRLYFAPPNLIVDRETPTSPIRRVCRHVDKSSVALLPAEYRRMFDAWPDRLITESLCLLYVALTRAAQALHIILSPSRLNEKSFPKTLAGVARFSLVGKERLEPDTIPFQRGNRDWDTRAKDMPPSPAEIGQAALPEEIRLRPSPAVRRRGLARRSPSSLEGAGAIPLDRRLRWEAAWARARGVLLHAWFEQIEWLDDGAPSDEILRAAARRKAPEFTGDLDGDLDRELAAFRDFLSQPMIREILSKATYVSSRCPLPVEARRKLASGAARLAVFREAPFALRETDHLIQGRIDRIVVAFEGERAIALDLIDFKSDSLGDDPGAKRAIERYRPQIEAYSRAAARLFGVAADAYAARVLFIETSNAVSIHDALGVGR